LFEQTIRGLPDGPFEIYVLPTTEEDKEYVEKVAAIPNARIAKVIEPMGKPNYNHGKYFDLGMRSLAAHGYPVLFSLDDDVWIADDRLLSIPDLFERYPHLGSVGPEWQWDKVARGTYSKNPDALLPEMPPVVTRWVTLSFCAFYSASRYVESGGGLHVTHDGDITVVMRLLRSGYYNAMSSLLNAGQPTVAQPGGLQEHARADLMFSSRKQIAEEFGSDYIFTKPQNRYAKSTGNDEIWTTSTGEEVVNFKFSDPLNWLGHEAYRMDHGELWAWRPRKLRQRKGETDDEYKFRAEEYFNEEWEVETIHRTWAHREIERMDDVRVQRLAEVEHGTPIYYPASEAYAQWQTDQVRTMEGVA
jgi:hypothetical protein